MRMIHVRSEKAAECLWPWQEFHAVPRMCLRPPPPPPMVGRKSVIVMSVHEIHLFSIHINLVKEFNSANLKDEETKRG